MVFFQRTAESIGHDIMHSIQSYLRSGASTKQINFGRGVVIPTTTTHTIINFKNSLCKPKSKQQSKLLAAKKHREAEKRRRLRISGQYATLRTILPNLIKMDKVSVLRETIRQVKELKKAVAEVEATTCHGHSGREDQCVVPSGDDRLSVEHCEVEEGEGVMKAVLSCEDRVGLMSEMTRAVRAVKGKVVKAEMVTVGGRTKTLVWVKGLDGSGNEGMVVLRKALKVIVERRVLQATEINRKFRFVQSDL